jgi:hypothetical protein
VQIQAYLSAIVQNLNRLLFPLYCWLVAHRWSYSTSTTPALPSNQSWPPTNRQTKNPFTLFQQARWVDDVAVAVLRQSRVKSSEQTFFWHIFRASENVCHEGGIAASPTKRVRL